MQDATGRYRGITPIVVKVQDFLRGLTRRERKRKKNKQVSQAKKNRDLKSAKRKEGKESRRRFRSS